METTHPLRQWRQVERLSQEAAAKRLGLKTPTLSRYETGKRVPTLTRAKMLSEKTGIPIGQFVQGVCE